MAYFAEVRTIQITRPYPVKPAIPSVRYSAAGLPPGLSMDANGRVTGTISPVAAGDYAVIVTVQDSLGGDASFSAFTWTVSFSEIDFDNFPVGTVGLSWFELNHVDVSGNPKIFKWAMVPLPDPSTYYGGMKDPRVLSFSDINRALSNSRGQFEGIGFSVELADTDRLLRSMLDNVVQKFLMNRTVLIRSIDDIRRRTLQTPRVVIRGKIQSYKPADDLKFEINAEDPFTQARGSTSVEKVIPYRKIGRTDFPVCPDRSYGDPVPIIYGELSDLENASFKVPDILTTENVTAAVIGGAGSTTYLYTVTAVGRQGGPDPSNPAQDNDHRQENVWGQVMVTNAPSPQEWSASRYVRVSWNNVGAGQQAQWYGGDPEAGTPGGVGNRLYGRSLAGKQELLYGIANQKANNVFNDDNRPTKASSVAPTGNNQVWSGDPQIPGTTITIDRGRGAVPVIYVGIRDVGGTDFHEFVICGHAISSIIAWYYGGVRQDPAKADELDPTLQTILIPGKAAYHARFGTAFKYRDYNGRRYTCLFVKDGTSIADAAINGSAPITVNVVGIETVGDGVGAPIVKLAQIYKHFALNFLLAGWDGGYWNFVVPTWPEDVDGAVYPTLDIQSFDDIEAIQDLRIDGGYTGAIMFGGPNDGALSSRDAMARLNVSNDCQCGFNRNSQLFVTIFDDDIAVLNAARTYVDLRDILSFDLQTLTDQVENTVVYNYSRRYAPLPYNVNQNASVPTPPATAWDHLEVEEADAEAIAHMAGDDPTPGAGVRRGATVDLWGVRSATVAKDIMLRRLLMLAEPPMRATLQVGIRGLGDEIGDVIKVTHFGGSGPAGWDGRPCLVQRMTVNPGAFVVRFEAFDVERLYGTGFLLGDETVLPGLWTAADSDERRYAYLADETTGAFSDGSAGKRLR